MPLPQRKVLRAGDLAFTVDGLGNVIFDANIGTPGIITQNGKQVIDTIVATSGKGLTAVKANNQVTIESVIDLAPFTTGNLAVGTTAFQLQAGMKIGQIQKVEVLGTGSNIEFKVWDSAAKTNLLFHSGNPTKHVAGDVDGVPWIINLPAADGKIHLEVVTVTGTAQLRFTSLRLL